MTGSERSFRQLWIVAAVDFVALGIQFSWKKLTQRRAFLQLTDRKDSKFWRDILTFPINFNEVCWWLTIGSKFNIPLLYTLKLGLAYFNSLKLCISDRFLLHVNKNVQNKPQYLLLHQIYSSFWCFLFNKWHHPAIGLLLLKSKPQDDQVLHLFTHI